MKIEKYIIILFFCISTLSVSAQSSNSHNKADSLLENFDYSTAASYYLRCTSDKDSLIVFRKLAQCYRKTGDYKSENYTLLRIPKDSLRHDDMRQIYYSYSRLQDTVSMDIWGQRILKEYPFDGDITASVAADMMQKGNFLSAKTLAQCYLDRDSLNLFVWRQYGYSCYMLGEYENALTSYLRLNEHGWNNYEVNFIIGVCYGENGNSYKAYKYLLKANGQKDAKDYASLKQLADNCLKLGMPHESAAFLERAINIVMPDSLAMFRLYNMLGEAYFQTHEYSYASRAFRNAAKMNPEHALTYYNIAQMYNGMKDKEEMLKYYKLFIKYSDKLPENEENKELIERVRAIILKI